MKTLCIAKICSQTVSLICLRLIEEKEKAYSKSNINGESIVKWTGKYIPKKKLFNKVVLASKYQLKHVNGLTFDFLYKIAKDYNNAHVLIEINISEQVAHILHHELEYENMIIIKLISSSFRC